MNVNDNAFIAWFGAGFLLGLMLFPLSIQGIVAYSVGSFMGFLIGRYILNNVIKL